MPTDQNRDQPYLLRLYRLAAPSCLQAALGRVGRLLFGMELPETAWGRLGLEGEGWAFRDKIWERDGLPGGELPAGAEQARATAGAWLQASSDLIRQAVERGDLSRELHNLLPLRYLRFVQAEPLLDREHRRLAAAWRVEYALELPYRPEPDCKAAVPGAVLELIFAGGGAPVALHCTFGLIDGVEGSPLVLPAALRPLNEQRQRQYNPELLPLIYKSIRGFLAPFLRVENGALVPAVREGEMQEKATALLTKEKKPKTLILKNHFIFYGSLATPQLAFDISKAMMDAWNEPMGVVTLEGIDYLIQFEITHEVLSFEETLKRAKKNVNSKICFIYLFFKNISDIGDTGDNQSKYYGNSMFLNIAHPNILFIAPHEFGHLWGWYDMEQAPSPIPNYSIWRNIYLNSKEEEKGHTENWDEEVLREAHHALEMSVWQLRKDSIRGRHDTYGMLPEGSDHRIPGIMTPAQVSERTPINSGGKNERFHPGYFIAVGNKELLDISKRKVLKQDILKINESWKSPLFKIHNGRFSLERILQNTVYMPGAGENGNSFDDFIAYQVEEKDIINQRHERTLWNLRESSFAY